MILEDLMAELQKGRVYECSLRSDYEQVHGLQEGDSIYIDPRPAILDTLLHELLHRRYPKWGERRVRERARLLVLRMDEPTKRNWWRAYRRVVRRTRPVEVDD